MSSFKDNIDRAGEYAGEKLRQTSERVRESVDAARTVATDAYAVAREKADIAYQETRKRAGATGKRAQEAVQDNPVAAVLGGLAVGALIGALLPRGKSESKLLGNIGSRINDAGRGQLDKMGLSADAARDKVTKMIDGAVSAMRDRQN